MPKIKLIRIYDTYYDIDISSYATNSLSDWEEVTEEELRYLKSPHAQKALANISPSGYNNVIILEEITCKKLIQNTISSVKGFIKKEQELQLKEEKAKKERSLALKKKKEAKEIEKAKKILLDAGLSVEVK